MRLRLEDIAAEQMLRSLQDDAPEPEAPPSSEDEFGQWDEERLVSHFETLAARAGGHADGREEASSSSRPAAMPQRVRTLAASALSEGTVWFGRTPIVLRTDTQAPQLMLFLTIGNTHQTLVCTDRL